MPNPKSRRASGVGARSAGGAARGRPVPSGWIVTKETALARRSLARSEQRLQRHNSGRALSRANLHHGLEGSPHSRKRDRPGSIDTPGLSGLLASSEVGEQPKKMISAGVPLGRFGTPEEIARAQV
jgi:hypothetical protein